MGTGGDLEYIATLSDKDFKRSLGAMDREAQGSAGKQKRWNEELGAGLKKGWGGWEKVGRGAWMGVAASAGLAIKAVKDYAEINSYVKSQLTDMSSLGNRAWHDIGSGISGLMMQSNPVSSAVLRNSSGASNWVADQIYGEGSSAGFDAAQKGVEQADIANANGEKMKALKWELDINDASRVGNRILVERLEQERTREERLKSIASVENGPEKEAMIARINSESEEAVKKFGAVGLRAGFGSAALAAFNVGYGSDNGGGGGWSGGGGGGRGLPSGVGSRSGTRYAPTTPFPGESPEAAAYRALDDRENPFWQGVTETLKKIEQNTAETTARFN